MLALAFECAGSGLTAALTIVAAVMAKKAHSVPKDGGAPPPLAAPLATAGVVPHDAALLVLGWERNGFAHQQSPPLQDS